MQETTRYRLTDQQTTDAVTAYARKHGFPVSTVRTCTAMVNAACDDYRAAHPMRRRFAPGKTAQEEADELFA